MGNRKNTIQDDMDELTHSLCNLQQLPCCNKAYQMKNFRHQHHSIWFPSHRCNRLLNNLVAAQDQYLGCLRCDHSPWGHAVTTDDVRSTHVAWLSGPDKNYKKSSFHILNLGVSWAFENSRFIDSSTIYITPASTINDFTESKGIIFMRRQPKK